MSATQRILLFGGSFDPVHHGHLIISRDIAEQLGINTVILVPGRRPPHKTGTALAPVEHRLAMCRLATEGDPVFSVSDWEATRDQPGYTLHTVEHFHATLAPDVTLFWLIGMDSLNELHTWHRAADLVDACTIVTAARPGHEHPTVDQLTRRFSATRAQRLVDHIVDSRRIDISSTDIRMRVRAGRSIRHLVPLAVEAYIAANHVYV